MTISIQVFSGKIHAQRNNLQATLPLGDVKLADLGCKLLGTLPKETHDVTKIDPDANEEKKVKVKKYEINSDLQASWTQCCHDWKNTQGAQIKMGDAFISVLNQHSVNGLTLIDTMRTGSDYWRPGKLLSGAIERVHSVLPDAQIDFKKEDLYCPTKSLLRNFLDTNMPFGQYARQYADTLHATNAVKHAMTTVVFSLAEGKIPVFYCTDPYIPDFGKLDQRIRNVPYENRSWCNDLRDAGCHRMILVEEIYRGFQCLKVDADVFSIIPNKRSSKSWNTS